MKMRALNSGIYDERCTAPDPVSGIGGVMIRTDSFEYELSQNRRLLAGSMPQDDSDKLLADRYCTAQDARLAVEESRREGHSEAAKERTSTPAL